jgi:hypothetical protein
MKKCTMKKNDDNKIKSVRFNVKKINKLIGFICCAYIVEHIKYHSDWIVEWKKQIKTNSYKKKYF